jgi:hypothetical protein
MKLNLSSTWTNKRIRVLMLLTLLKIHQVKSGSEFSKCLGDLNYEGIIKYNATNSGGNNYLRMNSQLH